MKFSELYKVIMESGLVICEEGVDEPTFDSISGFYTTYTDEEWDAMRDYYADWTVTGVQGISPDGCDGLIVTVQKD